MLKNAFKVKVKVPGGRDFGEFDNFAGGELDAEESKYTPFDGVERVYLAFSKVGNVNVGRMYEEDRDGAISRDAKSLHLTAVECTVLERDKDGIYQQNRDPYVGLLKKIEFPEGDSNSNDVEMLKFEISVGAVGA